MGDGKFVNTVMIQHRGVVSETVGRNRDASVLSFPFPALKKLKLLTSSLDQSPYGIWCDHSPRA